MDKLFESSELRYRVWGGSGCWYAESHSDIMDFETWQEAFDYAYAHAKRAVSEVP